jgi:hypothetical protein
VDATPSPIPATIGRLAVLYPRTSDRDIAVAYRQLEWAAFQLTARRPSLQLVERNELPFVQREQRLQLSGLVSEETAVRVGQLLGVDGILFYRIDGPTLRDQVLAHMYGGLPPVTVVSKVILVESGQIVFHDVVTAAVEDSASGAWFAGDERPLRLRLRAALHRGVAQTEANLWHAFR